MTKKQAKNIFRIVLLVGTVISLFYVPWILVKAWAMPLPTTVQEQVDEAISHGFDGMIVYVDQAGQAPEYFTAGWHDRVIKIPARPQALFKIASIAKLYVAVAITKLAHAERLSLDESLTDYFPELNARIEHANDITLRMMVQHRSGIPNYVDNPEFWSNPPNNKREVLAYALDLPANFKPGKDYGYSNTNYLLLSNIIEKVVGYSRQRFIKEEILDPLGLKNTFGSIEAVNLDDVMSGYYVGLETDFKSEEKGMVATAEDVGIFLRALNEGRVFKKGERAIYSTIYEYEHTGLVPGYQSFAKYYKDKELGLDMVVIQFNNTTNFQGFDWNLAQIVNSRIIKILKKRKILK